MKLLFKIVCVVVASLLAFSSAFGQSGSEPADPGDRGESGGGPLAITADNLYANSSTTLYQVNAATGVATYIGSIGYSNVTDIAFSGTQLFGITFSSLLRISPTSGAGTVLGSVGYNVNALAAALDGTLYAATTYGQLIRIDKVTGRGTLIGYMSSGFVSTGDLAFLNGKLYSTVTKSNIQYLVTLNTSTGAATVVGMIGYSNVYGLTVKDGTLYGGTVGGSLLRINTTTGAGTLVGAGGLSYWGMSSLAGDVPYRDTGFRPNPDGYNFANYGGNFPFDQSINDYTRQDMVTMFGTSAACAWTIGSVCVLKPQALLWYLDANSSMNGGHCDGMASTSLRFFKRLDYPATFQSGAAATYQLSQSNIRRQIANYFVRQTTEPVRGYKEQSRQNTPAQILTLLATAMTGTIPDPPTLFVRQAGKGGHAITPYAIYQAGNGVYRVMVYDNNHPNDPARFVTIDTAANTWSYDLGSGLGVWSGDANTKSLGIVPISKYGQQPTCPWCGSTSNQTSHLTGAGNLLIADSQGRRIGYVGGQRINEIPNATLADIDTGLGGNVQPIYVLPVQETYSLVVTGEGLSSGGAASVSHFGPDYSLSVTDLVVTPGSQDRITVNSAGTSMAFQADNAAEPTVSLASNLQSGSGLFTVRGVEVSASQTITLAVDTVNEQLVLANSQSAGAYGIDFTRYSQSAEKRFVNLDIAVSPGDVHYFDVGGWDGNGAITLSIDAGGDGSIDETLTIENQLKKTYLPVVRR